MGDEQSMAVVYPQVCLLYFVAADGEGGVCGEVRGESIRYPHDAVGEGYDDALGAGTARGTAGR